MYTSPAKSILCVVAHADDLEMMAGGTLAKWIGMGCRVHALVVSDSVWVAPDGTVMRDAERAKAEQTEAATYLGYSVECLGLPAMDLKREDRLVVDVLKRLEQHQCDTLVTTWERDTHHDHEVVSRISIAASRRIPRVLMGQVNHYLNDFFTPNVFVDVSDTWEQKIEALKCYKSEWGRVGADWLDFIDATSRYYGRMVGVRRAEGFMSSKLLL